ncbi:hypothetical protein N9D37_01365 [Erythrobacter sp.]|nr:hypothetical protein [Erythrobacter sp.]
MIQISFEPAFDPYHTAFRFLAQTRYVAEPIAAQRARIFDIYVLEPFRVKDIRVPQKLKSKAKAAANCQRPLYGRRPSSQSLYNRMRPIHDAALQTLALHGAMNMTTFEHDKLNLVSSWLSTKAVSAIDREVERLEPLLEFLHETLAEFSFDGVGGIKDRTKLGEFKYDVV